MSDLADTIQESASHSHETKLNAWIAIWVAITATFMALCNVKDGNIVQAMQQSQAKGIDAWSFYQAKSTKESIVQNNIEMLKVMKPAGYEALVAKQEEQVERYEKEKADIKKQAEGYQKDYDAINVFDDQFDMTDALLSISIALFGITSLTRKKWLYYFSIGASSIGIILGLAAFMKVSLHSDLISSILG